MPFEPSFVNGFVQISVVLQTTPGYVIDGARFYQLPLVEYSLSQENSWISGHQAPGPDKWRILRRKGGLNGLTLAGFKGIIRRFPPVRVSHEVYPRYS